MTVYSWVCGACGFNAGKRTGVPIADDEFPVHCLCGATETLEQFLRRQAEHGAPIPHWLTCQHRGSAVASLNGSLTGSGCASSLVDVYQCIRFNEPVIKQAAARCMDKIAARVPGYTGRTCRECSVPKSPDCQPPARMPPVSTLVAVTAHFNPQHSSRRRENWFRFAEGLADKGIYLLTIEGIRDRDSPDLPAVNSVRQICFRDVLWQKERLLNLLIDGLPDDVDAVAWFDADLTFDEPDLRQKILDGLSRWPILQPWSRTWMHKADGSIQYWGSKRTIVSLASVNRGRSRDAAPNQKHPGFAWAARRETLTAMGGFYDRHITGGGDTAMALGFYGDFQSGYLQHDRMSPAMMSHWLAWAKQAHNAVRNRVGYVEGLIHHLYHGEIPDRGYKYRWTKLAKAGYDPARHVRVSETGALEWTEEAPEELKRYVEDYLLRQRKEP